MDRAPTRTLAVVALAALCAPPSGASQKAPAVNLLADASDLPVQLRKAVGGKVMVHELTLSQVFTVTCKKGFSIDEADFGAVPGMLKDAVARLNLEDGEAGSINLSRGVFCKEPRWVVFVDGKRKDGMVEYDPKGKFRNSKIM